MSRYSFRLFFMLLDILSFPIICNTYVLTWFVINISKELVVILVAKTVLHVNEKAPVAERHGRNWPYSAIAN